MQVQYRQLQTTTNSRVIVVLGFTLFAVSKCSGGTSMHVDQIMNRVYATKSKAVILQLQHSVSSFLLENSEFCTIITKVPFSVGCLLLRRIPRHARGCEQTWNSGQISQEPHWSPPYQCKLVQPLLHDCCLWWEDLRLLTVPQGNQEAQYRRLASLYLPVLPQT